MIEERPYSRCKAQRARSFDYDLAHVPTDLKGKSMAVSRRKFIHGGLGMLGLMLSAEELFKLSAQAAGPAGGDNWF